MGKEGDVGLGKLLGYTRSLRATFATAILIMNSIFLGKMEAYHIPIGRGILITEGFAVAGVVGIRPKLTVKRLSNYDIGPFIVIPIEAFLMGCYIFIATVYTAGKENCSGYADTPFGDVQNIDGVNARNSCGMQAGIFASAIIVAVLSFGTIVMEFRTALYRPVTGNLSSSKA